MQSFKRLFIYSKQFSLYFIMGLILAAASTAAEKVHPYLSKLIVDDVLMGGEFHKIGSLATMILIAVLFRGITMYGNLYCFHYMSQGVLYNLRRDLYDKLQSQSFEFYDKNSTGHLMNRMVGDLNAVQGLINKGYMEFFEGIVSLVFAFSIMFYLNFKLTFAILIIIPLLIINGRALKNTLYPVFRYIRTAFENLTSFVQENVTGIRVVKAFGREEQQKAVFEEVNKKFVDGNIKAADARAKHGPLSNLIMGVGIVIILFYGGYLVMRGEMSVGDLVAFNGYMLMLRLPIMHVNNLINQWENAGASLEKIFYLMDQEPVIQNKEHPVIIKDLKGDIKFEDVYFKYNTQQVLKNINLHLPPGSVTAIMGATGSGKSTIINLIARFYDCSSGRILIDGYDVCDLEMDSLRKHIGIISQDIFLFSDTIADNIAFSRPDAEREEIIKAAKVADIHDYIIELDEGYDTVVGERGVGLSGGQKQRIAIARAIVSDPKILIMDDATSSVDMETEREIQQTMKQVMNNRTTLIIAHRISTVKDADHIIYLEDGIIVEHGSHKDLLELKGKYYETFREQYREYGNDMLNQAGKSIVQEV